jgi:hypothetical protein
MKKLCSLRGQKDENKLSEPKNGRVIYPSIENFTWSKKKYTFGGQKTKISLNSPKKIRLLMLGAVPILQRIVRLKSIFISSKIYNKQKAKILNFYFKL